MADRNIIIKYHEQTLGLMTKCMMFISLAHARTILPSPTNELFMFALNGEYISTLFFMTNEIVYL